MIRIALPKGRLGDKVTAMMAEAKIALPEAEDGSRRLIITDEEAGISFFLVKPWDVPVYVEHGAADVGVAGLDTIVETGSDVYELLDLGIGKCRMAVAGPRGGGAGAGHIRVATKYPVITRGFFAGKNTRAEIIRLSGSIELAPLIGLSDCIVDIVETGATLRENGLDIYEEIMPISARLIANKTSCKFGSGQIEQLAQRLGRLCGTR